MEKYFLKCKMFTKHEVEKACSKTMRSQFYKNKNKLQPALPSVGHSYAGELLKRVCARSISRAVPRGTALGTASVTKPSLTFNLAFTKHVAMERLFFLRTPIILTSCPRKQFVKHKMTDCLMNTGGFRENDIKTPTVVICGLWDFR